MLYTFMNKNYKLFDFEYDLKINAITKIINLYDKERLPVNLYSLNEDELLNSFNTWLNQRYSRNSEWFKKQQWNYDFMKLTSNLVVKSYGLSLSDQYWIKPSNDNKAWEDVNFFTNKFNFYSFGDWKFKIKVLVGLVFGEGCVLFLRWYFECFVFSMG